MGTVNITLANGQLGTTLQTSDGICGLVVTGQTEGAYTVGTPILITSMATLAAAGITATNNEFAYKQVKEFYDHAGAGALLYLMLVPAIMNISSMADVEKPQSAKKLLDYANGKIRLLGIVTDEAAIADESGEIVVTDGLNEDVYVAITKMQTMANAYFSNHKPFRALIGGVSYSGVAASLAEVNEGTSNRVSVLIGDTTPGSSACVGLALGVMSAVPVQRKISRVRSGALLTNSAYVGTATAAGNESLPIIAGKGFVTFATYANSSGFYFSGDPTCTTSTDDYAMLARGRVIDKAHTLAYGTFVQVVDDEVPINNDGTLDAGYCKWLSQQIVNQINNTMTARKEISSVRCFIDPNQNILATNTLHVALSIIPVGYATNIEITLGFINPANA